MKKRPPTRRRPARTDGQVAAAKAQPASAGSSGIDPWLYTLGASFLLLIAFAARYLADADLGYHLQGGRWILDHHRFLSTDVYTYTRSSADYLDLHWLYQILIYSTYRAGGYASLTLLNIFLVALAFAVTLARLQMTGAPRWMSVLLLVVALLACELRFHVRPEILTWIFMSLMLWVLEMRTSHNRNYLFLLPLIQLIWTNSEGLFGIGWGLMGLYLVSDLVHGKARDTQLWVCATLAFLSCLINPYFVKGAMLPFTYLATLSATNPFKQSIAEFQSPWLMGGRFTTPTVTLASYKLYSVWLLVLLIVTFMRRKLHEILLAAVFFYLSATALRNIPLFVLATLPLAARSWNGVTWNWLRKWQSRTLARPAAAWIVLVMTLAFAARAVTSAHYISEGRQDRFGLGLDGETQPVGAGEFLVRNHLEGRILNQVNTGGWLDWVRPGQVFVDGRTEVMGEELFVESMSSLAPGGLERLLAKYHPDMLFVTPSSARQWILDLNTMPDWRPVYLDEGAVVFLRKDYAPHIPLMDEDRLLDEHGIAKTSDGNATALLRAPAPPDWQRFVGDFVRPAVHPNGLQVMALFFQYRGEPQMSAALFLECIRRSRGSYDDFYFNAGLMYYGASQLEKSRLCMERVLSGDPDNAAAQRVLANIQSPTR